MQKYNIPDKQQIVLLFLITFANKRQQKHNYCKKWKL